MSDYQKPGEKPFLSNCSLQLESECGFPSEGCVIHGHSGSGTQKEMGDEGDRGKIYFPSNFFVFVFIGESVWIT